MQDISFGYSRFKIYSLGKKNCLFVLCINLEKFAKDAHLGCLEFAVVVNLEVNGTAAFHTDSTSALDGKIHFTGAKEVLNADANKPDAVIVDVTKGAVTATVDVNLTSANEEFKVDDKYVVTVYLAFEIDNSEEDSADLDVEFDKVSVNGAVGTKADFTVTSVVLAEDKSDLTPNAEGKIEATVVGESIATYYLEVVIVTSGTANAEDATFQIVLPVNAA